MENIGVFVGQFLVWVTIAMVIFGVLEAIPLLKIFPGFKYVGGVLVIIVVDASLFLGGYIALTVTNLLGAGITFCLTLWYASEGYLYWEKRLSATSEK